MVTKQRTESKRFAEQSPRAVPVINSRYTPDYNMDEKIQQKEKYGDLRYERYLASSQFWKKSLHSNIKGGSRTGAPPPPTHTHLTAPFRFGRGWWFSFLTAKHAYTLIVLTMCILFFTLTTKHRVYMLRNIKTVRRLKEFYAGTAPPGFEIPGSANGQNNNNLPVEGRISPFPWSCADSNLGKLVRIIFQCITNQNCMEF